MKLSECDIINLVRLDASQKGIRLWRNNVGAGYMNDGRFIRWGLANESEKMNNAIKSSDLIGIKPILITEEFIGQIIGQFVSREIKNENWKYCATKHEKSQKKWIELINNFGGDAAFTTGIGSFNK